MVMPKGEFHLWRTFFSPPPPSNGEVIGGEKEGKKMTIRWSIERVKEACSLSRGINFFLRFKWYEDKQQRASCQKHEEVDWSDRTWFGSKKRKRPDEAWINWVSSCRVSPLLFALFFLFFLLILISRDASCLLPAPESRTFNLKFFCLIWLYHVYRDNQLWMEMYRKQRS